MRLAFSSIAWDVAEDEDVAALLRRLGLDAIDIAPGKYFPDPAAASDADILAVRRRWADRGFEITGMQALLFGTSGLNVFGPESSRSAMLQHLQAVCHIGGVLGATRLVFGSPRNRDRSGVPDAEVPEIATRFFRQLGDIAAQEGVVMCLEPNPPRYGANFMTTSEETCAVVRAVGHRAIRMQLDTGALAINAEDPHTVLANCAAEIGHIHASEPDLVPLGDGGAAHDAVYRALQAHLPDRLVSIEMVATAKEPHLASIERAARVAARCYGAGAGPR